MKNFLRLSVIALLATAGLRAQYGSPVPAGPTPGLIDDLLRADDPALTAWDFGVSYRLLLETGYGHYFRGEYITESFRTIGSKDANYLSAQATLNL